MYIRKKTLLDGMDREILRVLYLDGPLVTRDIGKAVGLSSPAVRSRLENLRKKKIIKAKEISKIREFKRGFNNEIRVVRAPRFILWDLDLKKDKKIKNRKNAYSC